MSIPKLQQQGNKLVLMVHDKPFIALAGEVHNSDSSSPEYMKKIYQIGKELGMNTLLLPVSWEMVEPVEGEFDFSIPMNLISQAREHHMKIVFLWFGSWKNAECMYTPEWVKTDLVRFKRGQIIKGQNKAGRQISVNIPYKFPYTTMSYLCKETMIADGKAFEKFMEFLKMADENENTVIAVQVENESGLLGAAREQSDQADDLFFGNVPQDFIEYMNNHTTSMVPDVRAAVTAGKKSGNWSEVFGAVAEELFSAYYISRFVEYVAKQGKKVYPLPMAVNCWLDKNNEPGLYPSGGPVSRMHEVWHCNAPTIDLLCPDIYVPNFYEVCDEYTRRNTPLFIPEAATHSYCAPRLVHTIGHYHAIGYSPFGFDDIGKPFSAMQGYLFGMDVTDPALKTPQSFEEYSKTSSLLSGLLPIIGEHLGSENLKSSSGESSTASVLTFSNFSITTMYQSQMQPRTDGYCLAVKVSENECYILGNAVSLTFASNNSEKRNLDILMLKEGEFKNGIFIPGRRLNGDEAAHIALDEPRILYLKYFLYD